MIEHTTNRADEAPREGALVDGDNILGVYVEIPPEQYTSGLHASLAMIDRSDGRNLSVYNVLWLDTGQMTIVVSHAGNRATQEDIIRTLKFAVHAIADMS